MLSFFLLHSKIVKRKHFLQLLILIVCHVFIRQEVHRALEESVRESEAAGEATGDV